MSYLWMDVVWNKFYLAVLRNLNQPFLVYPQLFLSQMIQQYFSIFLQPFFHLLDSACCFFISYIKLPFLIKKKTTEATVASYIKFIYRIYLSSKLSYTTFKKQKPFIKKKRDFQKPTLHGLYPILIGRKYDIYVCLIYFYGIRKKGQYCKYWR